MWKVTAKKNFRHEILGAFQYVVCDYCEYKEPTRYAPTETMECPNCGASMPKPKNVDMQTIDLHKLCMSPQRIETLSKYYGGDKKE